ncbi:MAG: SRPBCC family protein [Gordonia sp. (in: high G+C Gram-positive bacteria)]|uniref:SRPBCC family protein n=1 Tax=Gordonia sp. (in: high G+C Gram-positive bacteria) TaxID=84139 RepID=UPI0039E4DA67
MTDPTTDSVSDSVTVAADPATVYALITDLPTLASLAEETQQMRWKKGTEAVPGAVFTGSNRNGVRRWSTTCTVTDADPGKCFGFEVKSAGLVPIARWQYEIAPAAGGCTVTETTWDHRPAWFHPVARLATGVTDRPATNAEHIRLTLQRLKELAEA